MFGLLLFILFTIVKADHACFGGNDGGSTDKVKREDNEDFLFSDFGLNTRSVLIISPGYECQVNFDTDGGLTQFHITNQSDPLLENDRTG